MVVPGAIASRVIRTSTGPAGMSGTIPPTRSGTTAIPEASSTGAVATHSPVAGVAAWAPARPPRATRAVAAPTTPATIPPVAVRRDIPFRSRVSMPVLLASCPRVRPAPPHRRRTRERVHPKEYGYRTPTRATYVTQRPLKGAPLRDGAVGRQVQ